MPKYHHPDALNILPTIKHLHLNPGLGRLFPERVSRIEVVEEDRAQQVLELSCC